MVCYASLGTLSFGWSILALSMTANGSQKTRTWELSVVELTGCPVRRSKIGTDEFRRTNVNIKAPITKSFFSHGREVEYTGLWFRRERRGFSETHPHSNSKTVSCSARDMLGLSISVIRPRTTQTHGRGLTNPPLNGREG